MEASEALNTPSTSTLASVESSLPPYLWADVVEPVVIRGWALRPRHATSDVVADFGAQSIPAVAVGIERDDVFELFRATPSRSAHARWSGYMLAGVVGPLTAGTVTCRLTMRIDTGELLSIGTREVEVREFDRRAVELSGAPEVAIAMATFSPHPGLFAEQIDSIRAQTHQSWVCIVCDDCSPPSVLEEMRRCVGDDPRFVFVENDDRLGFYRNFERALALVPANVSYVALADQDDRWYPHKIERLVKDLEAERSIQLVTSDVRMVSADGTMLSSTFYHNRIPTHNDPYSLFMVNSLVGASMVFRRALLDYALPFPRAFGNAFHDHWLARTALVCGRVGFEDEPLHEYVQHAENVLGGQPRRRSPMREVAMPYARNLVGGAYSRLPAGWADHFLTFVVEPKLAAETLRARCPDPSSLEWMNRLIERSSYAEMAHIVLDHYREERAERRRRDGVEAVLLSGGAWALQHQPVGR